MFERVVLENAKLVDTLIILTGEREKGAQSECIYHWALIVMRFAACSPGQTACVHNGQTVKCTHKFAAMPHCLSKRMAASLKSIAMPLYDTAPEQCEITVWSQCDRTVWPRHNTHRPTSFARWAPVLSILSIFSNKILVVNFPNTHSLSSWSFFKALFLFQKTFTACLAVLTKELAEKRVKSKISTIFSSDFELLKFKFVCLFAS